MMYYGFDLFLLSRIVHPPLVAIPLMYGSLLTATDKERSAPMNGAIILFLYAVLPRLCSKCPRSCSGHRDWGTGSS